VGHFTNQNLNDIGVLISPNGQVYKGEFFNNQADRIGWLQKPDGTQVFQCLKDGKRDGPYVEITPDGIRRDQAYINGAQALI
jgi:hypothetical protein